MVFTGAIVLIAFGTQMSTLNDVNSSEIHAISTISSHNVAGVFIAWLILAFESGTLKWIDKFVSLKLWKLIGKLAFCICIINPIVSYYKILKNTNIIRFDSNYMVKQSKIIVNLITSSSFHSRSLLSLQLCQRQSCFQLLFIF